MKIAVFGAAGWTGRAVLENLAGKHDVYAVDHNAETWNTWRDIDGDWNGGPIINCDIVDYHAVSKTVQDMDAVIHLTVYFPGTDHAKACVDHNPFLINAKGLWNVLDASHRQGVKRIVHVGSCGVAHPDGCFFESDIRRPDYSLYAVTKRLQEEMCRQHHEGLGQSIIVLRPCYIVDSRLGIGRYREKLGPDDTHAAPGWVCRHDLAEACRLAAEIGAVQFDILHVTGMPEDEKTCNVARGRKVLGLTYRADLEQYRQSPST